MLKIVGAGVTGAALSPFIVACQQEARATQGAGFSYFDGYFFKGGEYIRYDLVANMAVTGYPKPITSGWPGLWADGADAITLWPNGKAYFFKGNQFIRYDPVANTIDAGYPKPIAESWPG
ncbi:MAG: hemopexin repeat-containing protein, partial [Pseudonocardiaceae bacterium]